MNAELEQVDLRGIARTVHPAATEYTYFSAPHCTYSKIDHIIRSKSLLSKYIKMEIITNSLADHSATRANDLKYTRTQYRNTQIHKTSS